MRHLGLCKLAPAMTPIGPKYDTCFFERYAMASLRHLLGEPYDTLVNRDRPDLQCDDHSLGIEVTRAIREDGYTAKALINEMAGTDVFDLSDTPYAYGFSNTDKMSRREYRYWTTALPMQRILENKIRKVSSGFYGDFERMGLYIFSKEDLIEDEVASTLRLAMQLQQGLTKAYDTIFISQIQALFVCDPGTGTFRIIDIDEEMGRRFYEEASKA